MIHYLIFTLLFTCSQKNFSLAPRTFAKKNFRWASYNQIYDPITNTYSTSKFNDLSPSAPLLLDISTESDESIDETLIYIKEETSDPSLTKPELLNLSIQTTTFSTNSPVGLLHSSSLAEFTSNDSTPTSPFEPCLLSSNYPNIEMPLESKSTIDYSTIQFSFEPYTPPLKPFSSKRKWQENHLQHDLETSDTFDLLKRKREESPMLDEETLETSQNPLYINDIQITKEHQTSHTKRTPKRKRKESNLFDTFEEPSFRHLARKQRDETNIEELTMQMKYTTIIGDFPVQITDLHILQAKKSESEYTIYLAQSKNFPYSIFHVKILKASHQVWDIDFIKKVNDSLENISRIEGIGTLTNSQLQEQLPKEETNYPQHLTAFEYIIYEQLPTTNSLELFYDQPTKALSLPTVQQIDILLQYTQFLIKCLNTSINPINSYQLNHILFSTNKDQRTTCTFIHTDEYQPCKHHIIFIDYLDHLLEKLRLPSHLSQEFIQITQALSHLSSIHDVRQALQNIEKILSISFFEHFCLYKQNLSRPILKRNKNKKKIPITQTTFPSPPYIEPHEDNNDKMNCPLARSALQKTKQEKNKKEHSLLEDTPSLINPLTLQELAQRPLPLQFAKENNLHFRIITEPHIYSQYQNKEESSYEVLAENNYQHTDEGPLITIKIAQEIHDIAILAQLNPTQYESFIDFIILNELIQANHRIQQEKKGAPCTPQERQTLEGGSQIVTFLALSTSDKKESRYEKITQIYQSLNQVIQVGHDFFYQGETVTSIEQATLKEQRNLDKIYTLAKQLTPSRESSKMPVWNQVQQKIDENEKMKQQLSLIIQETVSILSSS